MSIRWITAPFTLFRCPAKRHGRKPEFVYSGELSGIPLERTALPGPLLHHHGGYRRATRRGRRHARHPGRRGERIRPLPPQGQAGLHLQSADIGRFRWEARALQPGKHSVAFDFTYDGPGLAKGGKGVLTVDGVEVATREIPRTIPFTMPLMRPSMSASIRAPA